MEDKENKLRKKQKGNKRAEEMDEDGIKKLKLTDKLKRKKAAEFGTKRSTLFKNLCLVSRM